MIKIKKLDPDSAKTDWDQFITSFPFPIPFSFNPSYFDFYKEYFHWKPFYFLWYHEKRLMSILPMVYTGRSFVSLPHFSYGGLLTRQEVPDVVSAIQQLVAIVNTEQLEAGFYRYDQSSNKVPEENGDSHPVLFLRGLNPPGEMRKPEKVTSYLELSGKTEDIWRQLSSNLRRKIRKAKKSGIDFREGGVEMLEDFCKVYSQRMHQLGFPAYGKNFFRLVFNSSETGSRFFVGYINGQPIGSSLLLSYNGFYESAWFATDTSFQRYYVSDGLHWAMIKYALESNGRIYSMGRSTKNSGVFVYKNHWPVRNSSLYIYNTSDKASVKDFEFLSKIWKLIPFQIANIMGPKLLKHIY